MSFLGEIFGHIAYLIKSYSVLVTVLVIIEGIGVLSSVVVTTFSTIVVVVIPSTLSVVITKCRLSLFLL